MHAKAKFYQKSVDRFQVAATSMLIMNSEEKPTDAQLVVQTLAGEHESFGCLFDRYAKMVRAVVGRVSLDWSTVEDLTQESFLRAFRKLDQLREHERFGSWVVGIARQVARERKRTLSRDRHQFVGDSTETISDSSLEMSEVGETDDLKLLMKSLETLSEQEQLAIHAFFLQERNANQAAEILKLSRSGFYSVLKKAIAKLALLVQLDSRGEGVKR